MNWPLKFQANKQLTYNNLNNIMQFRANETIKKNIAIRSII